MEEANRCVNGLEVSKLVSQERYRPYGGQTHCFSINYEAELGLGFTKVLSANDCWFGSWIDDLSPSSPAMGLVTILGVLDSC
jgi:hypothetical protein